VSSLTLLEPSPSETLQFEIYAPTEHLYTVKENVLVNLYTWVNESADIVTQVD